MWYVVAVADSHRRPRCMERATLAVDTSLVATFSISWCRGIATCDQNIHRAEGICLELVGCLWGCRHKLSQYMSICGIHLLSLATTANTDQYCPLLPRSSKNSEPDWSTEQLPIAASMLLVVPDCHSKPRPSCSSPWHAATASFARFKAWSESKLWGHSQSNLLKILEWFSDRLIQMETSWCMLKKDATDCNSVQKQWWKQGPAGKWILARMSCSILQWYAVMHGHSLCVDYRYIIYWSLKRFSNFEDPNSETHLKILKILKCEDYGHDTSWQCAQCYGNQTYPAKIWVHFDAPLWSSLPSRPTPSSLGRRWPWKRMKAINCSAKSKNHFLH